MASFMGRSSSISVPSRTAVSVSLGLWMLSMTSPGASPQRRTRDGSARGGSGLCAKAFRILQHIHQDILADGRHDRTVVGGPMRSLNRQPDSGSVETVSTR